MEISGEKVQVDDFIWKCVKVQVIVNLLSGFSIN